MRGGCEGILDKLFKGGEIGVCRGLSLGLQEGSRDEGGQIFIGFKVGVRYIHMGCAEVDCFWVVDK